MRQLDPEDSLKAISESCSEAERLLNELDNPGKPDIGQGEINTGKPQDTYAFQNSKDIENNQQGSGCLVVIFVGALIGVIAIASQNQYATQNAYEDAMKKGKDAVLVAEHEEAINMLEAVKEKGLNPNTMNNGQLNNAIIRSRKLISYLKQPGRTKYQEERDYGYQWYNKHGNSAYRLFFAHSRRCKQPLIRFTYRKTQSGPALSSRFVKPKATMSTINVPYRSGATWLRLESFRCN